MSEYTTSRENDRDDDQILARLRAGLAQSEPAPPDLRDFASAAFTWGSIDAELASLDYDSVEEEIPAGVRSTATARMLSFQAGQWMLDIEFDPVSGRLLGHISPQASYTVELHTSGALFSVESDEVGRFEANGVAPGPLSMVLRFADRLTIKTQWVVL